MFKKFTYMVLPYYCKLKCLLRDCFPAVGEFSERTRLVSSDCNQLRLLSYINTSAAFLVKMAKPGTICNKGTKLLVIKMV